MTSLTCRNWQSGALPAAEVSTPAAPVTSTSPLSERPPDKGTPNVVAARVRERTRCGRRHRTRLRRWLITTQTRNLRVPALAPGRRGDPAGRKVWGGVERERHDDLRGARASLNLFPPAALGPADTWRYRRAAVEVVTISWQLSSEPPGES